MTTVVFTRFRNSYYQIKGFKKSRKSLRKTSVMEFVFGKLAGLHPAGLLTQIRPWGYTY